MAMPRYLVTTRGDGTIFVRAESVAVPDYGTLTFRVGGQVTEAFPPGEWRRLRQDRDDG